MQMAQPAWKTDMQQAQQAQQAPQGMALQALQPMQPWQPLATIVEEDGGDATSQPASMWSPPDGYQSSTSTQRAADAARDAQDFTSLFDDADWDEQWRIYTEDLYWARTA